MTLYIIVNFFCEIKESRGHITVSEGQNSFGRVPRFLGGAPKVGRAGGAPKVGKAGGALKVSVITSLCTTMCTLLKITSFI